MKYIVIILYQLELVEMTIIKSYFGKEAVHRLIHAKQKKQYKI